MEEVFISILKWNAIIGTCLFAYGVYGNRAVKNWDEDRDSKYPAYRRYDTKNWNYLYLYLGAITLMPVRAFLGLLLTVVVFVHACFTALTTFHRFPSPHNWWGKLNVSLGSFMQSNVLPLIVGCHVTVISPQIDYSFWLGKDYKPKMMEVKNPSMVVSNHTSWLDPYMVSRVINVGYLAKKSCETTPIIGPFIKILNGMFIDRGATEAQREKQIKDIEERQELVEKLSGLPPLCLFAEGGTSNGHYLLAFKKGAFAALKSIKAIVLDYRMNTVSPAYDVVQVVPLVIIQLCQFRQQAVIYDLPIIVPTDYLFETHKDKGTEKWEIYAWAVRDIMSKAANMPTNEQPYREKLEYEAMLHGYKISKGA